MDFGYTKEQEELRATVREFAEKVIMPKDIELDRECKPWREIFYELGKRGWMGLIVPRKYDGQEKDSISLNITYTEVARASASIAANMDVHYLLMEAILRWGSEELKEKYLPQLATGKMLGAFAITERGAGSDAAAIEEPAVLDGNEWVLNGEKCVVVGATVADAFTCFFRTGEGRKGITAFVVEKKMGIKALPHEPMGLRGCGLGRLVFDNVRVPKENVIGNVGDGLAISLGTLDFGRIGIGCSGLGVAIRSLELATQFAREREAFGRKIGEFEEIMFRLAEIATEVDSARLLLDRAAWLRDQGVRYTRECAMAKWYATELGKRAADFAIQVYGHAGYVRTQDYLQERNLPIVEKLWRDARALTIAEGTTEIQKFVVGRLVLAEERK